MNSIAAVLDGLEAGQPVQAGDLTMIPLLGGPEREPRYITLDQGLARGTVRVSEVSEQGRVPELLVLNEEERPVLLMDGEELVGAKQNRIVNLSILVPALTRLNLPVSCVEAGRWHRRSREFSTARRAYYASGRAMKMRSVTFSYRRTGCPTSDQSAIWNDIACKSARLESSSPTRAMDAMYERLAPELATMEASLPAQPRQVGALFLAGGAVLGLDVFDSAATWRLLAPKLIAGYGLEAFDRRERHRGNGNATWPALLQRVRDLHHETYPAVGLGTDVRLEGCGLHGAALVVDDRVIHLALFDAREAA